MRILTFAGTRPELVRLSRIVPLLDEFADHTFVHTGQNEHPGLRDVFFDELGLRAPDEEFRLPDHGIGARAGAILAAADDLIDRLGPQRIVILGDTDSGLAAYVAARRGVPVAHLEAGNRCHDLRVPEEINRRVIDHVSRLLLPYTERSAQNLVREGIERQRITVVGNPIAEVLAHHAADIEAANTVRRLGLSAGEFMLLTLHRSETVDDPHVLAEVIRGVEGAAKESGMPVVFPVHPRTADRLAAADVTLDPAVFLPTEPMGFFDFVHLQEVAGLVATDSGTVQEECTILHTRSITLRDVTERPETVECGSSIIAGRRAPGIARAAALALAGPADWPLPRGYEVTTVARTAVQAIAGHLEGDD